MTEGDFLSVIFLWREEMLLQPRPTSGPTSKHGNRDTGGTAENKHWSAYPGSHTIYVI